jgi:ORF6N domain
MPNEKYAQPRRLKSTVEVPAGASNAKAEEVTRAILLLRGHRALLNSELALHCGVTTKRFNEQVRRNAKRLPADFMFQLTAEESSSLRSEFATLTLGCDQHRKYLR